MNDPAQKEEENFEEIGDSGFELEIVDDTPEEDRNKPRRADGQEPDIPEDDEIANYGENVQKRIKQLKYEFHEERRRKEEASRLQEEAVSYAQKIYEENQRLKKALEDGEGVLINQAKGRVEAELDKAKAAYKEAYESGDPDALVNAQEKLTELQAEKLRVNSYKPKPQPETPAPQAKAQQVQKPDEHAMRWAQNNEWFNKDKMMTAFAYGVHEDLVSNHGIDPRRSPQIYYERIDQEMRKRFPDKFDGQSIEDAPARQTGSVVAPASRSAKKPRRVQLTSTQVSLAKRLGLTNEQYAAQLLKESSNV